MRNPTLGLAIHHLRHRPIRVLVTILGVGVGVAAVLAMSLANQEIFRSFEDTVTQVVGEAGIQITGPGIFLDETVLPSIRTHRGVYSISVQLTVPVVVTTAAGDDHALSVVAVDVLDVLDEATWQTPKLQGAGTYLEMILDPHTVFLGEEMAARLNVREGRPLGVRYGSQDVSVTVKGIFKDSPTPLASSTLGLMDIAAAQSLFGLAGWVSQLDIVVDSGMDTDLLIQDLQQMLGETAVVRRSVRRTGQIEHMLRSFQLNLMTLSTVGLFVGVFLIYNVVGFSVVQHRREIGILRALGAVRAQIAALFLGEAAVIGILGGLLGTIMGGIFAMFLVALESQTVNELYTTVEVQSISLTFRTFLSGAGLGMLLALLGAIAPCVEASRTLPAQALAVGPYESTARIRPSLMAWSGLGVFALAGFLTIPDAIQGIPVFGYAAAFCILLGTTFFAPGSLQVLERVLPVTSSSHQGACFCGWRWIRCFVPPDGTVLRFPP